MTDEDDLNWGFESGKGPIQVNFGYRSTAHALAEIIDNSIQHNSSKVDVLIGVKRTPTGNAQRFYIDRILVVDNGNGMDEETIRRAPRIGDGTNHYGDEGMGRFGVGLPQASVTVADQFSITSWQSGYDSAIQTALDIKDQEWLDSRYRAVPAPIATEIPPEVQHLCDESDSGTIIQWSNLTRLEWKQAKTLYENTNFIAGRMYRNFIKGDDPQCQIRFVSYDVDSIEEDIHNRRQEWKVNANDPLYRLTGPGMPVPHCDRCVELGTSMWKEEDGALFESYTSYTFNDIEGVTLVNHRGDIEYVNPEITIVAFHAKRKTRRKLNGSAPGNQIHGKHMGKNVGVSFVRENREIILDGSWDTKDTRERWTGVEVRFGRDADTLFGVTTSKQEVQKIAQLANKSISHYAFEGEDDEQTYERMKEEDKDNYWRLKISAKITELSLAVNLTIRNQSSAQNHSHSSVTPPDSATELECLLDEENSYAVDEDEYQLTLIEMNEGEFVFAISPCETCETFTITETENTEIALDNGDSLVIALLQPDAENEKVTISLDYQITVDEDEATVEDEAAGVATGATAAEIIAGNAIEGDLEEGENIADRWDEIRQEFADAGMNEEELERLKTAIVNKGHHYFITKGDPDTAAFFVVVRRRGVYHIQLNVNHPMYDEVIGALTEDEIDNMSEADLKDSLTRAGRGLLVFLEAWARYESGIPEADSRKDTVRRIRRELGQKTREFLEHGG